MAHTLTVHAMFNRKERAPFTLKVGDQARVSPLNPIKTRYRGRVCTVLGFESKDGKDRALVRFYDCVQDKTTKVDAKDLVPTARSIPVTIRRNT